MVELKDIQGNLFSCRFFTPNTIVLNHTLKIQYAILHIQYFIFTVSLPELCKGGIICIGKKLVHLIVRTFKVATNHT